MRNLIEITPDVCRVVTESIHYHPLDGGSRTFKFVYDDENWSISGVVEVGGEWHSIRGDYEWPAEEWLSNGWGFIVNMEAECRHEETDERINYPIADFNSLWAAIDSEINRFMCHYKL